MSKEMTNETKDRLERCIEIALDNRTLEIELVWKRTAIFWIFVAAIFVAVVTALQQEWPPLSVGLSVTGVVFSLIWTLANRGSRSWQESWELKAEHFLEERYGPVDVFGDRWERGGARFCTLHSGVFTLKPRRYSLSGLLVALSDFVVVFWVCLTLYTAQWCLPVDLDALLARRGSPGGIRLVLMGTLVYCAYVLVFCRSRPDRRDKRIESKETDEE